MLYAIIQENICGGIVTFSTVFEICTSYREMARTMERIRKSFHEMGWKGEHQLDDSHTGVVMACQYTTPMGAKYRFSAYGREKNVKWGNFPF